MDDKEFIEKIKTLSFCFKSKEQLPLGNKSRGRFIEPEGNKPGILIPSYGVLEKEEIDYIAEASLEKREKEVRLSQNKIRISNIANRARNAKEGERAKTISKIISNGG